MSKIVQVDMIVQQIMNLFPDNKQNNKNKEKKKKLMFPLTKNCPSMDSLAKLKEKLSH